MKKTILSLIISLMVLSASAQVLDVDGFWGIHFGASKQDVQKMITDRWGTSVEVIEKGNYMVLLKVEFGGLKFDNATLTFKDDMLCEGAFTFAEKNKNNTEKKTDKIISELTKKYNIPWNNSGDMCVWGSTDDVNITVVKAKPKGDKYQSYLMYTDNVLKEGVTSKIRTSPFLGFRFGDPQDRVEQLIKSKMGKDAVYIRKTTSIFASDITLNGTHFDSALFAFNNGKLYSGIFGSASAKEEPVSSLFYKLTLFLVEEYDEPESKVDGSYRWGNADNCVIMLDKNERDDNGDYMLSLVYTNFPMKNE